MYKQKILFLNSLIQNNSVKIVSYGKQVEHKDINVMIALLDTDLLKDLLVLSVLLVERNVQNVM